MFGSAVVAVTTNLQKCPSLCSAKAEFVARSYAVRIVVCQRIVLEGFRVRKESRQVVQDNISCIGWTASGNARHVHKRNHSDIK